MSGEDNICRARIIFVGRGTYLSGEEHICRAGKIFAGRGNIFGGRGNIFGGRGNICRAGKYLSGGEIFVWGKFLVNEPKCYHFTPTNPD